MQQKMEKISVPRKRLNFSGSLGPIIAEMGISFDLKMLFRFSEMTFDFFAPEFGFSPTVSGVIEQLIRGNSHRIPYATCFRMTPGFTYLSTKMMS